jgi:hypothetical protein
MRHVAYPAGVSFKVAVQVGLALCGACGGSSPAPFEDHMARSDAGPPSSSVNPPIDATTGAMSATGATDSAVASMDSDSAVTKGPAASMDSDSAVTKGDADEASDAAGSNEAADAAGGCRKGCGAREVCAYLIADACGAAGTCVAPPPQSTCNAIVLEMGCGCDGHTVHWDGGCKPALPDGYAPAPVTHTGACN